jgi:glucosamine 6-phosphate synthetase-like amidotransferase/phosphosugar isomerase protein
MPQDTGAAVESRADSSGLVFRTRRSRAAVLRAAVPLAQLQRSVELRSELKRLLGDQVGCGSTFTAMGHSRLVTNGSQTNADNNQPVVKDGVIGVHNGIIVNEAELWARHPAFGGRMRSTPR